MLPILFSLGPIHIYSFGLFFLLAFLAGSFVVWRFGRKETSEEFIFDLIFYTIIISLIGGRVAYILSRPDIFETNVLKMLHIFNFPGLSYYWSLITGLITLTAFSLIKKINPLKVMDFFVLGFSVALILGEFGCFLNGCVVGIKTNLLPLFEILVLIPLLFLLFKIFTLPKKFIGLVTAVFFLVLGISQFLLEIFRDDSVYLFNLKFNQFINLIFILGSSILLLRGLTGNKIKSKIKNLFNK